MGATASRSEHVHKAARKVSQEPENDPVSQLVCTVLKDVPFSFMSADKPHLHCSFSP
jgi:hypothetical protein